MNQKSDIGLIGLAVMGENLVLNIERNGFAVSVYNRTATKMQDFMTGKGKGRNIRGYSSLKEFCSSLKSPRKILFMIKAGNPVDHIIEELLPFLEKGDILIDGGNSHFMDTIRRTKHLEGKEFMFIGTGISGGEEGALRGPAIMPGGSYKAWEQVKPVLQAIAARAEDNSPCCEWIGNNGAGHFVKMIHNGIEYGDMQMISEAYGLLKDFLGMQPAEIHDIFDKWNTTGLNSYLIEITKDIFSVKDEETGKYVVDLILDSAGQKGTGKWTSQAGLDLGVPVPTIAEAVFARCISSLKEERVYASKILKGPRPAMSGDYDRMSFTDTLREALYASKICSYAQGFHLMKAAAVEFGWQLDYGSIASIWRNGCIIRAGFLNNIKQAFNRNPGLLNLLLDPFFSDVMNRTQSSLRQVVSVAALNGIPVPGFSSALNYYDSYRTERLPTNLIQAQRDYFGAHTYERIDRPSGNFYHTIWKTN